MKCAGRMSSAPSRQGEVGLPPSTPRRLGSLVVIAALALLSANSCPAEEAPPSPFHAEEVPLPAEEAPLPTGKARACVDALRRAFVAEVEVDGRPELSCKYLADVPVIAPTAWKLKITALNGETSITVSEDWFMSGGMVLAKTAPIFVVFTPSTEGKFVIELKAGIPDEVGKVTSAVNTKITVFTIVPAEPDSHGRLAISGKWETYPNPATAESKRVRENARYYMTPLLLCQLSAWKDKTFAPQITGNSFLPLNEEGKRSADAFIPAPAIINKITLARMILQEKGYDPAALRVVSWFRPPSYNKSIGGAGFSRHIYGDGVDVIYDANGDDKMDDMNADGIVDRNDGIALAQIFRQAEAEGAVTGGIGVYEYDDPKSRLSHVHVDARGYITRWGTTFRTKKPSEFKWWPPEEYVEEEDKAE